jgi:NTE family protein
MPSQAVATRKTGSVGRTTCLTWLAGVLAAVALAGCASRPVNERLDHYDPQAGYRPYLLIPKRQNNEPSALLALSFSGGGTRAAALAYGVLAELRRTAIVVDGHHRRLLDEVDLITGVSGGSFTALAYALYDERLFAEYEARFLKRNVQGALIARALNPFNWWKFVGGSAGRSELAAGYYDEILFDGATFGDLLAKTDVPAVVVTGTDLSTGARLGFYQNDFDLLCTDLGKFRLSRAAATSSAVPVVLSPVTLNNYGGSCGYEYPAWVRAVTEGQEPMRSFGRVQKRYEEMERFQDSTARPFIHLVDGGVSDNIGARGILDTLEALGASAAFRGEVGFGGIREFIVIIVNSHREPSTGGDLRESPPGFVTQLLQASGVPIDRFSFETVETMKDRAEIVAWRRELQVAEAQLAGMTREQAEARFPRFALRVIDVSFDAIRDDKERDYFMNLPTTFALDSEQVDRLRDVAGRLLRQSAEYRALVQRFGGTTRD